MFCRPVRYLNTLVLPQICSNRIPVVFINYHLLHRSYQTSIQSEAWNNFQQTRKGTTILCKKNPETTIDDNIGTEEKELITSDEASLERNIQIYFIAIKKKYDEWFKTAEYAKIMKHFETKLRIASLHAMNCYISSAAKMLCFDKGIQIYEAYSPYFPTPNLNFSIIICYCKVGRLNEAMSIIQQNLQALNQTEANLLLLLPIPTFFKKRLLDNPSLQPLFTLESLEALKKGYVGFESMIFRIEKLIELKKLQNQNMDQLDLSFLTFEDQLQQFTNHSEQISILTLIRTFLLLIHNQKYSLGFTRAYLLKLEEMLPAEQFHKLLYEVCKEFTRKNLLYESVNIFTSYCATNEVDCQIKFFKNYFVSVRELENFDKVKEATSHFQHIFELFQIHKLNSEPESELSFAFYYLMTDDVTTKSYFKHITFPTFDHLIKFFFKHKQYDKVIQVWNLAASNFKQTPNGVHFFLVFMYFDALLSLQMYQKVIDSYNELINENHFVSFDSELQVLLASAKLQNMSLFAKILNALSSHPNTLPLDTVTFKRIILTLNEYHQRYWIDQLDKRLLSKHKLKIPLLNKVVEIMQKAKTYL